MLYSSLCKILTFYVGLIEVLEAGDTSNVHVLHNMLHCIAYYQLFYLLDKNFIYYIKDKYKEESIDVLTIPSLKYKYLQFHELVKKAKFVNYKNDFLKTGLTISD